MMQGNLCHFFCVKWRFRGLFFDFFKLKYPKSVFNDIIFIDESGEKICLKIYMLEKNI